MLFNLFKRPVYLRSGSGTHRVPSLSSWWQLPALYGDFRTFIAIGPTLSPARFESIASLQAPTNNSLRFASFEDAWSLPPFLPKNKSEWFRLFLA